MFLKNNKILTEVGYSSVLLCISKRDLKAFCNWLLILEANMSIQINKLHFSYPHSHSNLFEDFSISLYDGWTCIAGSNGCGKTTLLKLIAGMLNPDGGTILLDGENITDAGSVLYSAFWSPDNEVRRFFSMLHISEEMLERYDSLSGGEKKRIQIASALAENPSVLLLDEPTNHLDAETVQMITEALKAYSGIGIMVSHDRSFSDSLCTRTLYLYRESNAFEGGRDCISFESYPCGLSKALELRLEGAEQSRGQWERLNSKAASEKQRSARLEAENQKSRSKLSKKTIDPHDHDAKRKMDVARISGKDRSTGDAKARLETQIRQTEEARDSVKKSLKRKEGFSVEKTDYTKPILIEETVITAGSYSLKIPHIELAAGIKFSLTGQNGAGKTLFIRQVISLVEKNWRMDQVMYLPQEVEDERRKAILEEFSSLDEDERGDVLSTMFRLGSEPERIGELRMMTGKDDSKSDSLLSPGELRKLMISLAVQKPLSLLILDEPTNHMDITSVLALEEALSSLDCAMIAVSHDRAFLQKVTNASLVAERHGDQGEIKGQV